MENSVLPTKELQKMKKIAILFCIGAFFICTAYSEEKKNFIKVDKNVEIDEKVYEFFYDFFSKNSKNTLDNGSRMILDAKKTRLLDFNYYDRQGYFNSYFLDDKKNFYVIDKILIKGKKTIPETSKFYLELGILYEDYYDVTFNVKSIYDKEGNLYTGIREFTDKIGVFIYSDKCLLSQLGKTTAFTWILEADEEAMLEKLKKGELEIEYKEDVNHYTVEEPN